MTFLRRVCVFALIGGAALSPARAELAFEQTTIKKSADFDDETIEAEFVFENTGDRPVRIRRIETSCGCTAAAASHREIAPGEENKIAATFHIGQRIGVRRNKITIQTMRGREYPLVFETTVPRPVMIEPRMLSWQIDDSTEWQTARVQMHPEAKLNLTGATVGPGFEARLEPTDNPLVFELHVRPDSTDSSGRTLVQIQSKPEIGHQRRLAVFAYVR